MENLERILDEHYKWLRGEGGEKAVLKDADLRDTDLSGVDLKGANLSGADLRDANLNGANLEYVNLNGADLRDTNLRDANLSGADLRDANLSGTDLRDANLNGVDLSGANLKRANLNWVNTQNVLGMCIVSVQTDTSRKNNLISFWKELGIYTTGCFQGTKEELINSVNITHKDDEVMRNKYIKTIEFIDYLTDN